MSHACSGMRMENTQVARRDLNFLFKSSSHPYEAGVLAPTIHTYRDCVCASQQIVAIYHHNVLHFPPSALHSVSDPQSTRLLVLPCRPCIIRNGARGVRFTHYNPLSRVTSIVYYIVPYTIVYTFRCIMHAPSPPT